MVREIEVDLLSPRSFTPPVDHNPFFVDDDMLDNGHGQGDQDRPQRRKDLVNVDLLSIVCSRDGTATRDGPDQTVGECSGERLAEVVECHGGEQGFDECPCLVRGRIDRRWRRARWWVWVCFSHDSDTECRVA